MKTLYLPEVGDTVIVEGKETRVTQEPFIDEDGKAWPGTSKIKRVVYEWTVESIRLDEQDRMAATEFVNKTNEDRRRNRDLKKYRDAVAAHARKVIAAYKAREGADVPLDLGKMTDQEQYAAMITGEKCVWRSGPMGAAKTTTEGSEG